MFSREQKSHSNTRKHRSPRPRDRGESLLHLSTHAPAFVHSELCRPQPACDLGQDCPSLGLRLPSSPCQPRRRVSGAWSMLSDLQGSLVPGRLWLVSREVTSACSPDSPSIRDPGAGAAGSATGPRVGHTPLQPPQDSWRVSHRPRRWRGAKPPETPAQAGSLSAGLGTSPLPHLHFAPRNSSPDVAFQSTRGLRTLILRPEDDLTPVAGASCRPTQLVPQERPRLCRVHGRSCTGGGAQVVLTLIAFSYVSPDHCSGNGLFLSSEKGQARCGLLLAPSPAEADRDPCTFPAAWSRLPVAQGSSRWPWSQGPAPVGG